MYSCEVVSSSSTRRLFQLRLPVARHSLEEGEMERVKRWLDTRSSSDGRKGRHRRDLPTPQPQKDNRLLASLQEYLGDDD